MYNVYIYIYIYIYMPIYRETTNDCKSRKQMLINLKRLFANYLHCFVLKIH